eukprot:6187346-Pleurochrysis_carterae.AAC.1
MHCLDAGSKNKARGPQAVVTLVSGQQSLTVRASSIFTLRFYIAHHSLQHGRPYYGDTVSTICSSDLFARCSNNQHPSRFAARRDGRQRGGQRRGLPDRAPF